MRLKPIFGICKTCRFSQTFTQRNNSLHGYNHPHDNFTRIYLSAWNFYTDIFLQLWLWSPRSENHSSCRCLWCWQWVKREQTKCSIAALPTSWPPSCLCLSSWDNLDLQKPFLTKWMEKRFPVKSVNIYEWHDILNMLKVTRERSRTKKYRRGFRIGNRLPNGINR